MAASAGHAAATAVPSDGGEGYEIVPLAAGGESEGVGAPSVAAARGSISLLCTAEAEADRQE